MHVWCYNFPLFFFPSIATDLDTSKTGSVTESESEMSMRHTQEKKEEAVKRKKEELVQASQNSKCCCVFLTFAVDYFVVSFLFFS